MCMAGQTRGWKWPLTAVGTSSAILYPLRPIYNYLPLYSSAAGTSNVADTQHEGARVATLLFVLIMIWYYQVFTAVWWGKIFPCVYLYYNLKSTRPQEKDCTEHEASCRCVPGAAGEVDSVDTAAAVTRPPPQRCNYGKECREIRTTSVQSLLLLHSPLSRQDNRYLSSPTPAPAPATPRHALPGGM